MKIARRFGPNDGRKKHPLYHTYTAMVARCYGETNREYIDYGGRGIRVCESWLGYEGFPNFLHDMGEKPSKELSLDRIDVNGHYAPDNCRWASKTVQSINQRQQSNNKSGITGVMWNKQKNSWQAEIHFQRKRKHLGFFANIEEASRARKDGEKLYHTPLLEASR